MLSTEKSWPDVSLPLELAKALDQCLPGRLQARTWCSYRNGWPYSEDADSRLICAILLHARATAGSLTMREPQMLTKKANRRSPAWSLALLPTNKPANCMHY